MAILLSTLLVLTSIFLILLILVQRGRGGGLAGALGGMGGQSAFGTKAGDMFTRITIGAAAVWILLCVASVKSLTQEEEGFGAGFGAEAEQKGPVLNDPLKAEAEDDDAAVPGIGGAAPATPPAEDVPVEKE